MNRSEIIHRSSQVFLETMEQDEIESYVYHSAKTIFESMSDEILVDTIRDCFPSVVQFIREEDPDE